MPPQLVTIAFSHYCEKARWGLVRAGVAFDERPYAPLISSAVAWRHGRSRTVPQLLVPGGPALTESTDILRYADAHGTGAPPLFPDGAAGADVAELVARFDRKLGPAVRRIAYGALRTHPALPRLLLAAGPAWQQRLPAATGKAILAAIVRGLRITPAGLARSRTVLDEELAAVASRLADGRRYLCGETFTAADLTFAALCAPLVMPPAYQRFTGGLDVTHPSIRGLLDEGRATTAGLFALSLYDQHRP
jgi:glutathione S-transferase